MSLIKTLSLFLIITPGLILFGPRISLEIYKDGLNFENLNKIVDLLSSTIRENLLDCLQIMHWIIDWIWPPTVLPDLTLATFVRQGQAMISQEEEDILNLAPIEKFSLFAKATCQSASRLDILIGKLKGGLNGVPESVREKILEKTPPGVIEYMNSDSNTAFDVTGSVNTASVYYSIYHTKKLNNKEYRSCVLVSGMNVKIAEQIIAWEEEMMEGRATIRRFPVFKKSVVDGKQLDALFYLLVRNAVDSAKAAINYSEFDNARMTDDDHEINLINWKPFSKQRVAP